MKLNPMKSLHPLLFSSLLTAASLTLYGCKEESHEGHDHEPEQKENGEAHALEEGEEGHDHDHAHGDKVAGPNGGRVIFAVEPHAEFLVTDDRKVKITFLAEDSKTAVAPGERSVTVIAGSRSNPTRLAFTTEGDALVSDKPLPEGSDFPTVVQFQLTPGGDAVIEKFNLNLADCPTCEHKEYACTCEH